METDWDPPRCIHGRILLACPNHDCPTQRAFLDQQEAAMAEWERRQQEDARAIVRSFLGLGAAAVYRLVTEENPDGS